MSRVARILAACLAVIVIAGLGVFAVTHPSASGANPTSSDEVALGASAEPSATAGATTTLESTPTAEPYALWTPGPPPTPTPTPGIPYFPNAGRYTFPVHGCIVAYSHSHLYYPAQDIYAAKGCSFVAPISGRVDEVSYTDTWVKSIDDGSNRGGLSVSIIGSDGVRYYGSHLSSIAPGIAPGVYVKRGQLLGKTGDSGQAKGKRPHLHFGISWPTVAGIWWVRRGMVYPWPYLDAWRAGIGMSPAAAVNALHAKLGDVPACRRAC